MLWQLKKKMYIMLSFTVFEPFENVKFTSAGWVRNRWRWRPGPRQAVSSKQERRWTYLSYIFTILSHYWSHKRVLRSPSIFHLPSFRFYIFCYKNVFFWRHGLTSPSPRLIDWLQLLHLVNTAWLRGHWKCLVCYITLQLITDPSVNQVG